MPRRGVAGSVSEGNSSSNVSKRTHSPTSSLEYESSRGPTRDSSVTAGIHQESPGPPRPKRRNITRACDDCRRRKIKCDGERPCASCAEFNSECTYNRPSGRSRATKWKNTDALEERLQKTESILRQLAPHLDRETLKAAPIPAEKSPRATVPVHGDAGGAESRGAEPARRAVGSPGEDTPEGARFVPFVEKVSQLDLTDTGEYVFHGLSSGAAFLSRITQQFPTLFRHDSRTPFSPQPQRPFPASPIAGWPANYDFLKLPPKELARALCEYSFSRACCIYRVVHVPSFWKKFERLYEERPQICLPEQRRFVGLVFSVIALGSMYDVDENDPTNPNHYVVATDRGYKYYISARSYLQDITECGDMTTLQALVFNAQFLEATGNLSSCHSMIGIALRSALRMGLHRCLPHTSLTPIDEEVRRRVFYTIRQMDIYLSTTLGLPLLLQDKDIDQPWPREVNDEYITEITVVSPPLGMPSFLEAFNAHIKLMRILAKVVEYIYLPKGMARGPTDVTYMISWARIKEIEKDLHDWHENLPPTWRPGPPEEDTQITRIKTLLRFAYGHVQLMLYRPFLQFYSRQASSDDTIDERHLAFATAGINVCRNIIHIGLEIRRQAVLIGPYWFITYTQFLAILSVVLYVLHNPDMPGVSELFSDAKLGKDCISSLTQRSLAADRVTFALDSLFDKLPAQLSTRTSTPRHSSRPMVNDPQNRPRFQTEYTPQPPGRSSGFRHQEPWYQDAPPRPESGPHPSSVATPLPMPVQDHGPEDLMGFPIEDPFAYPVMPGVSFDDNRFTSMHDTMQLPLYDIHDSIDRQFMSLPGSSEASHPALMSAEASNLRSIDQAFSRGLNNIESGFFLDNQGPYGISPF
ncbi:hypothetical protein GQ53DRAFT_723777 [Thozetella sp. PMI_491]|nr:hypothetical protein GQ53DRAFT_723777 [Thozetella sp. PMI_491]